MRSIQIAKFQVESTRQEAVFWIEQSIKAQDKREKDVTFNQALMYFAKADSIAMKISKIFG